MADKGVSFKEIHNDFCNFVASYNKFSFYTRSINLQRKGVSECEKYLLVIKKYKSQAIDRKNEYEANNLFHMQCVINALRSYLLMWIQIKGNEFQKSWVSLIDAQEYLSIALKVNSYEGIINFQSQMISAENTLFSGSKYYLSSGFIETVGKCSICKMPFTVCEHIENEVYMGEFCQRIERKMLSIDHVAFVDNPRDRRCIITSMSDDEGNEINRFTLENTGKKFDNQYGSHFEGLVFGITTLDLK